MTGLRFHWKLLQSYGNGDENGPTLSCMVTSPKSPSALTFRRVLPGGRGRWDVRFRERFEDV
jgi:hypothetical protein